MVVSSSLDLSKLFPFDLDAFQKEAIAALDEGESVVVCAPTGSGKTVIAEYAVYRAIAHQRRVFYTTPLKALSNQKFRDFCVQFGPEQVGLLTGDISVNRDAPVVVMTTEIFRNMLYGMPLGEMGTSLALVEAVILDECHYMNDAQRGTVWEESIIYCPAGIQLVALSATIANSGQLTDWIGRVHGPTRLIYSDFRPVPLEFHFCSPKGLFPLLDRTGKRLNPHFKPLKKRLRGERNLQAEAPSHKYVTSQLARRDMLPAIYFIFSRRGCDQALEELGDLNLLSEGEQTQLTAQVDAFVQEHPEAVRTHQLEQIYNGIAVHHAGVLPAWKGLIEELFQQGLIKVVFATETLAAGINMPARTTVISMLSKRTDRGHRPLNASEFLQMAGRAGRRGMDAVGHVVTLQSPFESAPEAAALALSQPDPLVSQFTPSYGMVLNLLERHPLDVARRLIESSFGQYLATLHLEPVRREYAEVSAELQAIDGEDTPVSEAELAAYEKLRGQLREARRLLMLLKEQTDREREQLLTGQLKFALVGSLLVVVDPLDRVAKTAVLVRKIPGPPLMLVCLSADNRWIVTGSGGVLDYQGSAHLRFDEAEHLTIPAHLMLRPGGHIAGSAESEALSCRLPTLPVPGPPEAVIAQKNEVERLREIQENHPAHRWSGRSAHQRSQHHREKLLKRHQRLAEQLSGESDRYWQEFLRLVRVLERFEFLDNQRPNQLGAVAAAIRGDNELWLALALLSAEIEALEPVQMAGLAAALVSEPPRPNTWATVEPSEAVQEAIGALRQTRRTLFRTQRRYQALIPIWLEERLVGLVELWARGTSWDELCSRTNLDEGDLVRLLRRTADLLRQVPHVPHLPKTVLDSCAEAQRLLDRFPVSEVV
ncbi:DEAD/DEAH box helicase [Gloeobacter kilaueensis]|uniref:Helicase n=1 Tax=Gloeobacter kilaueensis (strain ATCC BAA-2537 / CCAP 1431/1 / ULC 316 / JS1) TaxID=1183438 RepID=U5QGI1_GLOK1|nr:DEAD/DEAH box helicase [Gloeobacter kilaueensis]AGY58031.1 helicase [Gloeobacter kilaueensis JS1]